VQFSIVGLGNIAHGLEVEGSVFPQTHLNAFASFDCVTFNTCCDSNPKVLGEIEKKFNFLNSCDGIDSLGDVSNDLVVISVPNESHLSLVEAIVDKGCRFLIVEKPLLTSCEQIHRMENIITTASFPIIINYTRYWDSQLHNIRSLLNEDLRSLRSIRFSHSSTFENYGGHFWHFLRSVFDIEDFWLASATQIIVVINKAKFQIDIQNVGVRETTSFFEIDFVYEHEILSLTQGGRLWTKRCLIESNIHSGYSYFSSAEKMFYGYDDSMLGMAKYAIDECCNPINVRDLMSQQIKVEKEFVKLLSHFMNS
jgi:hypothetical protein